MVTPFRGDGSIDLDVAAKVATFLSENGSEGLVVGGSTGEGSALSDDEKLDLFACVASAVNIPVFAGSTSSDTARSVALTKQVAATGASGVLATTPAYARPSQAGIGAHLAAIADATTLPVMVYDIPARTGRKIASETMISLARSHANIVALKDASGDLPAAAHVKATLGNSFDLYSGDDALLLPFLALGAVGLVSVAAHWAGPEFLGIVIAAEKGEWEIARELNERVRPSCAFEGSDTYPNPQPTKAALRYLGFAVGECRLPLGPSDGGLDELAAQVVTQLQAARV
jgi:4-hydroxy-tetrahydrodipicolinate synthase